MGHLNPFTTSQGQSWPVIPGTVKTVSKSFGPVSFSVPCPPPPQVLQATCLSPSQREALCRESVQEPVALGRTDTIPWKFAISSPECFARHGLGPDTSTPVYLSFTLPPFPSSVLEGATLLYF